MNKINFLLIAVIVISITIRLWISWLPVPVLLEKIMVDDTFYGLSISKNIAYGIGMSFDGNDPSNGFQPLWLFVIAPFFWLINDLNIVTNLILTFASIVDIFTIILVYKFTKELFDEKIALLSAAFFGLNPLIIFQTLSGLDVVLSTFFVILSLYIYLKVKNNLNLKNKLFLGLVLGLSILARMDNILLFAAISIYILLSNKSKVTIKNFILISLTAFLVVFPWLLWSFITFGSIMPSSGTARYSLNHGVGPFFDYNLKSSFDLIIENVYRSFGIIFHLLGVVNFNLNSLYALIPLFLSIVLLFSFKRENMKKLGVFILYAIFLFIFYGFYFLGVQIRYFTPFIPAFLILLVLGLQSMSSKISKNKNIFYIISLALLAIIIINGAQQWNDGYFKWQTPLYQDALWLKENTKPYEVSGSFNTGILSFFSDRRVINLDGVVNSEVMDAIKNRSVVNYIKSKNVSFWVDVVHFNQTVYNGVKDGSLRINIPKDTYYEDYLGEGKEDLILIDQRYEFYKHLRGFDMVSFFFKMKVKYD